MWKESYRLGVELIDRQHMELFSIVGNLIEVVQSGSDSRKDECISTIIYMKEYSLQHFKDEEEYQQSINYPGFEEHRDIHQKFTQTILHHEQRMLKSNFDEKHIKDFMGTLIAWLVYHVAGTDQQIKTDMQLTPTFKRRSHIDRYFKASAKEALNKITGDNITTADALQYNIDDLQSVVVVKMHLDGDLSGNATFKYTKKLAFKLMKNMAYIPGHIDRVVYSAMLEISKIISNNALRMMSYSGISCNIENSAVQVHPALLLSQKGIVFDTGNGILEMTVSAK